MGTAFAVATHNGIALSKTADQLALFSARGVFITLLLRLFCLLDDFEIFKFIRGNYFVLFIRISSSGAPRKLTFRSFIWKTLSSRIVGVLLR